MSYLKDREIWLSSVPTGNPPAGYVWVFIQNGVFVVRDSNGVDKIMATTTGTVTNATSASYVEYSNVANKPALISGSSQVSYTGLSNIPAGIVSSSAQVGGYGVFATTGSNTFQNNQVITGSLFITQNLVVAGSSSIQYISSSVLDIADNIITVNAFNPGVRFGGLAVIDSGSSPQVSGSLLFDSIKDQWIFVHQNQAVVTSSVLLMGPETYNDLGNESYISANRLPKGSGVEHLRDSNITDTGTIVSINSNTQVTGSFTVVSGSAVELQVTNTGVNIGSALIDSHIISGSLRVNPNGLFVSGSGVVGINTTSPQTPLQILRDTTGNGTSIEESNMAFTVLSAAGQSKISIGASNAGNYGYVQVMQDATSWTNRNLVLQPRGGNVGIGTYSPLSFANTLTVHMNGGSNGSFFTMAGSGTRYLTILAQSGEGKIETNTAIPLILATNEVERMRITSGGNVVMGNNAGSAWSTSSTRTTLEIYGGPYPMALHNSLSVGNSISYNTYWDGTNWRYVGAATSAIYIQDSEGHKFFNNGAGSAGASFTPAERMRITSGGNVGIGTTGGINIVSGWTNLTVNGSTTGLVGIKANEVDYGAMYASTANNNFVVQAYGASNNGNMVFLTASTERMRIQNLASGGFLKATSNGSLFVSLSSPYHEFNNTVNSNNTIFNSDAGSLNTDGIVRIDALRNTTNNSFYVLTYYNGGSGTYRFRVADSGNVTNTNGSYGALSDIKLKENITDATPKLDDLLKVKVRNYNLIGEETKQIGVIAQELEEVFPSMVDQSADFEEVEITDEEGNTTKERQPTGTTTKSVKYSVFVPMLIKAIQELKSENDNLKSRLEVLEQS